MTNDNEKQTIGNPDTSPEAGLQASTQTGPQTGTMTGTGTAHAAQPPNSPLVSDHGNTSIGDGVVTKITSIATREIPGVYDLGGNTAVRAVGALRDKLPGSTSSSGQGVKVQVGERQTAIAIDLVAEYGTNLVDLAAGIRENVIASVEEMTGLEVVSVDITVHDVHLPSEDNDSDDESQNSRDSRESALPRVE